jgi:hypothetical protein
MDILVYPAFPSTGAPSSRPSRPPAPGTRGLSRAISSPEPYGRTTSTPTRGLTGPGEDPPECVSCDDEEAARRFDEGIASATGRGWTSSNALQSTKGYSWRGATRFHARRFIMDAWGMATSRS